MRYAIRYINSFKHFSDIDEVIFNYNDGDDLINILNQVSFNKNQTITINLSQNDINIQSAVSSLNKLKQEHANIIVQIDFYKQREYIEILKDNKISFMFTNFAKDLSTIAAMRMAGAAEVYIIEDICFSLDKLKKLREGGLKIRTFPDVAQIPAGCKSYFPCITKFFIRPEDIQLYEDYIDTLEFYQIEKSSVIYEIYKKEQWLGNLSDIIGDFKDDIPNTGISPHFGKMRINCDRKCAYGNCNICTEIAQLAPKFRDVGIGVIKKKKKIEIPKQIINDKIEELKDKRKNLKNESSINEKTL